ncbi:dienelactone hydrolase family protein [Microbacterium sp. A84]|uniref:dienelactone hydrolase family protein n=1 Tax=Microbacterium sp. A84 TaxID=3450715 RepID=UPI003F432FEC
MTDARQALRSEWSDLIGAERAPDAAWRIGESTAGPDGIMRTTVHLTSFGVTLDAVLLLPPGQSAVIVVPFYDVESLLGIPSERYPDADARPTKAFAREIAARGLGVLAVPWWAEIEARPSPAVELHARYGPVAAANRARFPGVTGLGRSIADLRLALDALTTVPGVDAQRLGAFGHSLGGKLALFLGALDTRIAATVTHEPGLGFAHSNWEDPWYLTDRVPTDRDLDEVLALIAPRPVLYVGGGASDGPHNANLAERAATAWPDGGLDVLQHGNGHPLPEDVLHTSIQWLSDHLQYSGERSQ